MKRPNLRLPDRAVLRAALSYNPQTGVLTHRSGPRAGQVTGSPNSDGYLLVGVLGGRYVASRVIFKMQTGREPEQVDHENLDRSDNRWRNLRAATKSQNACNSAHRPNRHGFKGVYVTKGLWQSKIQWGGVRRWLGSFKTAWAAHQAYRRAAKKLHGQFAHA